jgi:hypothetical protein
MRIEKMVIFFLAGIILLISGGCSKDHGKKATKPVEIHGAELSSGNNTEWSKPVNGLRARLQVLSRETSPGWVVFIEFENVSDYYGQIKIPFAPGKLKLHAVSASGKELPDYSGPYDGIGWDWKPIILPLSGTIRFRISFPGYGYRPSQSKILLDVNCDNAWVIPQDSQTYYLSGSFDIQPQSPGDPSDWSGKLELAKAEIPQKK